MIQMDDLEQVLNWNRFSIPILRQDSACRVLSCITLSIMAKIAVISLIKWEMTWGFRIRMSHPLVVNIFFLSSQLHDSFWKLRQKKNDFGLWKFSLLSRQSFQITLTSDLKQRSDPYLMDMVLLPVIVNCVHTTRRCSEMLVFEIHWKQWISSVRCPACVFGLKALLVIEACLIHWHVVGSQEMKQRI